MRMRWLSPQLSVARETRNRISEATRWLRRQNGQQDAQCQKRTARRTARRQNDSGQQDGCKRTRTMPNRQKRKTAETCQNGKGGIEKRGYEIPEPIYSKWTWKYVFFLPPPFLNPPFSLWRETDRTTILSSRTRMSRQCMFDCLFRGRHSSAAWLRGHSRQGQ